MEQYIKQLINDLRDAAQRTRPMKMELAPDLEVVRGAEEYLYGTQHKLGSLFGIEKTAFPPLTKLNNNQLEQLVPEIERLWAKFNFYPVFPDNLPAIYRYKLLIDKWDEPMQYVTSGSMYIEFCEYETENCPFPKEYCMCTDFD